MSEVHCQDGLYFTRLADGAIKVRKQTDATTESEIVFETTIAGNVWVSLIAMLSAHLRNEKASPNLDRRARCFDSPR